jgi:hypothetical protein
MAWVRFTADFDWPPLSAAHTAYKAGMRCNVPRDCLRDAKAAGVAEPMPAPPKAVADLLKANPRWVQDSEG